MAISRENGRYLGWKRSICSALVPAFLARFKMLTLPWERMILMQWVSGERWGWPCCPPWPFSSFCAVSEY